MILQVEQTSQDLYASDFVIKRKNTVVGNMEFQGKMGSRDGRWEISCNNSRFVLKHDSSDRSNLPAKAYRPYQIEMNDGAQGDVFDLEIKDGLFSKYDVNMLLINGNEFIMYPIGFGAEGAKNPIYHNGSQIAQIEKDSVVHNELYHYRILAIDEYAANIALLFCSYMYTCAGYKPGIRVTSSVKKAVTVTTNRKLKAFYDDAFDKRIEE